MSQSKQSTKSKRICVNAFFSTEIIKTKSNSHIPIDEAYMHRRLPEVHLSPTISPTSWSSLRIEQGLTSSPGSFCPSPMPPTPGQPCNQLPGALDCSYENHSDYHGLAGNCCCGQCDMDMTCAPDSTSGSGLWQPKHTMLCPTKGCGSEGEWWRDNVKQFVPFLKST